MNTKEIASKIEQNSQSVIDNINVESIAYYSFLRTEFEKSNITENHVFQLVARRFFGFDNVGFNNQFKTEYFKLFEKYRNVPTIDIESVFVDLHIKTNIQGNDSLIFSFATKLASVVKDTMPIYDLEVCKVFSFENPDNPDFGVTSDYLVNYFEIIKDSYSEIINSDLLPKTINLFDEKFKSNNLSMVKKLDFIIWSTGNLNLLNTANSNYCASNSHKKKRAKKPI
ncbi:MAG: hypothetical protein WCG93_15000 [Paludibacter sp.]